MANITDDELMQLRDKCAHLLEFTYVLSGGVESAQRLNVEANGELIKERQYAKRLEKLVLEANRKLNDIKVLINGALMGKMNNPDDPASHVLKQIVELTRPVFL